MITNERKVVREVLSFLLDNQYLQSGFLPGAFFRIVVGTGQGLGHSASVANCAFLGSVEVNGPGLARSATQQSLGILSYIRYM